MSLRWRPIILIVFIIAVLSGVHFLRPIPQDPSYHLFADTRTILGIANFFDVLSNLPFLVVGVLGLAYTIPKRQKAAFGENYERWPYIIFFIGIALTCLGSAYYHWSPNNRTLVWDRLPMAIAFMAIFAGTLNDRIGPRIGTFCLAPLLLIGILSVVKWYLGELSGAGDLRLYAVVQFNTIIAVFLLIVLFPARYSHTGWLIAGTGTYVMAKILESLDKPIFSISPVSGHTLKHLSASLTAFCILEMLRRRTAIKEGTACAKCLSS